jgi:trehalose 6-phosphate synthase/phosphatase
MSQYASAGKRLLLLDYDGSLVPFAKQPADATPSPEVLQILKDLASHSRNDVYVVSGRDSHTLETWLGHLPIGLVAEHGAKIRHTDGHWEAAASGIQTDWKAGVEKLLHNQCMRCPNSFIEHKEFSLAWHYRNSSVPEGINRANELYEGLKRHISNLPLQVLHGNKVIEVRVKGINKGSAVDQILHEGLYSFILCIGDDKTDEDMFRRLARVPEAFTIKVGNEASFAKYNLHSPAMVRSLLQSLSRYSTQGLPVSS